jgi:diguanylate cyclase (GGDEF)-like protein
VRALSHEQAARHLPVDIQATVTFYRGVENMLFVQEGDTGLYVYVTTGLRLQTGDLIRVRGTTSDSFNPIVSSNDITLLKHEKLPDPVRVSWPSLISADYDCRWVTVQGMIAVAERGISSGQAMTHLVLGMDGGRAEILLDGGDPAQFAGLLDAEVEITAVAGEMLDGKMQQTGARLNVSSFANIRVLKRSPVDPWSIPLTPMDKVLRGYRVLEYTPRVRVEGTLTYYQENVMAVLQDGDTSIRVFTSQWDPLNLGDRVEAIGVPFVKDGLRTLDLGQIRPKGTGAPATPRLVTWDDLASGRYSFNLVSVEGTVVSEMQEQAQDVYVISAGNHLFSASLQRPSSLAVGQPQIRPPMRTIPLGSKVRVTGVVSLETGNPYNGPIAFSILIRYEDDIATIISPPWWNVRHSTELVGLLALVVLGMIVWAWLFERGTRRKIAGMAYLEQRRSAILEQINGGQALAEILNRITELGSASLSGAPCWCQVADGARLGNHPPNLDKDMLRVVEHPISSRTGASLGTVFAAFDARTEPRQAEATVLGTVAGLAKLAIETSRLYSDLVHRSEFDLLTDVQNRFSLEKLLDEEIGAANQSARIFGLLYVDLDQFKQVNDLYGHQVGDLYLQEVVRRLKQQLRPDDILARLGGDEFAVLTPHVRKRTEVEEIAHRLERCFAEPFHLQSYILTGSASVGIAIFPEDGATRDSLLTAADASMYKNKHARQGI